MKGYPALHAVSIHQMGCPVRARMRKCATHPWSSVRTDEDINTLMRNTTIGMRKDGIVQMYGCVPVALEHPYGL